MTKVEVEKAYCTACKREHKVGGIVYNICLKRGHIEGKGKPGKIAPKRGATRGQKITEGKEYCTYCKRPHKIGTSTYKFHLEKGYIKGRESEKIDKPKGHKIKSNKGYCVLCQKYHPMKKNIYLRHYNLGCIEGSPNFGKIVTRPTGNWCVICNRTDPKCGMSEETHEPYCIDCYDLIKKYRKEGFRVVKEVGEDVEPEEVEVEVEDKSKKKRRKK